MPVRRIMVVEDDPVTGRILEMMLRQMGCEQVLAVPSGEEALASVEGFQPELILMDIRLKGEMNGIEAARLISGRLPVPVIFLTAHAEEGLVHRAKSAHPYGYILKPFDEQTVRIAIEISLARAEADRSLHASESRFRSLVEVTSDWIWEIDTEDRYTYASPKVRDVLGYEPHEMLGRKPFDFMDPEEQGKVASLFSFLKKSRTPFNQLENTNRKKDGNPVVIETSGVPIFDKQGSFCGYRGIDRDITQRKRTDDLLRESEKKYRSLAESLREVVYSADPERHRVHYVNRAVEKIFGTRVQEWTQEPGLWGKTVHPDDRDEVFRRWEEARTTKSNTTLEYRIVTRDRRVRWLSDRVNWETGEDGVVSVRGILTDITERKDAEARIVRAKREWEATFDSVPDGIMILDAQYRIVRLNRAMAEKIGLSTQEAVGRLCYECVHGTAEPPEHCQHRLVLSDGRQRIWEFYESFSGCHFLSSCSLLVTDIPEKKVVHILSDISEKKRLEKEIIETGDRERNRIGQDLHDELGQRLTGISFLCKNLESNLEEQAFPEAAELKRIGTFVREAIRKTREMAAGIRAVEPEAGGLFTALEGLVCHVEGQFGIECVFLCEEPVPVASQSVSTHLYRIAQEAIHNAVKHGGARYVEVALNRMGDTLYLSVENDGAPFTEKKESGEGLGLKIMRYRANMIGASLEIEGRKNGGMILTVKWKQKEVRENR